MLLFLHLTACLQFAMSNLALYTKNIVGSVTNHLLSLWTKACKCKVNYANLHALNAFKGRVGNFFMNTLLYCLKLSSHPDSNQ